MIGSDGAFLVGAARLDELPGLIELFEARPPAYWMRKISRQGLTTFLEYAVKSPRSVILVARPKGDGPLAGYVFAISDARNFFVEFALQNPAIAQAIFIHRLRRAFELRRSTFQGDGLETLPAFAWSPSHPSSARIIGLFVRRELERKGISMDLYFELCARLEKSGMERVEEYINPDLSPVTEKFFELCGWDIQRCRKGYKLIKELRP